ncbi:MAG: hypothetical protein IH607_00530 [Firmicutes bacterium]|nr:hypothetical protein [Bacillota bacterium]
MKRIIFTIVLLLAAVLVLQGCTTTGSDTATPAATATPATAEPTITEEPAAAEPTLTETPASDSGERTFTTDELLQYDGSNGNPAYIAVDGVVYDVTNVTYWRGGQHNGFTAGRDLTNEIKTISPHGVTKLVGLVVVGKLAD